MTEIKECKESQEVIDLVLKLREKDKKIYTNKVISNLLNHKDIKRYNGKEFKERDISTILLSQGVRRKSKYTKKKDNEEFTESNSNFIASGDISKGDRVYLDTDNTVKNVKQEFKIGDKVRVITKRLKEFDKVGKVVSIHHKFKDLVNVEFEGCKPDLYCTIHLELVKEEKQETEFKKADDKFKVGDKVRVSNEYCLEYDFIGVVIDFTSDVFLNYAQVKFDNINKIFKYNQDNLELVEEVMLEPVKEVEKVNSFKVSDLVVIDNEYTSFYGSVGTIKDVLPNGKYYVQMKNVNVVAEFIFTSLRKYNPEVFKLGGTVKIIDKTNNYYNEVGKIEYLHSNDSANVMFNNGSGRDTFNLSNLELVDTIQPPQEIIDFAKDITLTKVEDTFNYEAKEIIYKKDNKLFTDSLRVATVFDREHKNVLKSIENLECSPEFRSANFLADLYTDSFNRTQPKIEMTEKGFSMLAWGFTGNKATKFREKYLDKFEEMREALTQTKPITAIDLFSSQLQALKDQEAKLSLIHTRLENVENTLERQEVEKKELLDNLKDVEYSNNTAIEAPLSKKILAVIRKYVVTKFDNPGDKENQEAWYKLDKEIYDRLGFNIPLRKSNYEMRGIKKSRLQIMHELDILNQVFDIVSDIFKV